MSPRADYTRTLFFLCADTKENHLHINRLEQNLDQPILRITPHDLLDKHQKYRHKILLIDYPTRTLFTQQVCSLPIDILEFDTILINVLQRMTTDELVRYGNLKGLFERGQSTKEIVEGCQQVINGQNWLPRKVTSQLLHYYRHTFKHKTSPAVVDLTARELQILRYLQGGSSNVQMAESMFISEFTVKSHLYQIFRKLNVKNRVQAVAWADLHLIS
ncbi:LuxR C-terminal-related transcriptional regulator [Vibrio sp. WXL103]|uniref:LuxR C-terminal-related transcriptional regulator n=1 Tax=unclassified Vibrio TaxID=2614977 RepID=UPI003EC591B7